MMIILLLALIAAPGPGPDMTVLSRPIAGPYTHLLYDQKAEHDYDALHYTIWVEVLPDIGELEATAGVLFSSTVSNLNEIRFDFLQMNIDSVWDTTGPLVYSQFEDSVVVTLSSPMNPGDTSEVYLAYSGTPWNEGAGGFGGFWFYPDVYFHMGVGVYTDPPSLGRAIFPCWDHPSDKASIEFYITVPDTLYAVANGDQAWKRELPDGKAFFHWVQPQPMPTYLAAFAVSDYAVLQDSTYSWIWYYVYPDDIEDALVSFQNVDLMMDQYESIYCDYPWDTKFSYVETPKGDMEHLTQVYHIYFAINGYNNYDWLLAHEMSHHWWGNCVTEEIWTDVWLSEGFAVYSEAVWAEYYGPEAYDDYMVNDIMLPYLNSGEMFPITNPTNPSEMWSYTTYQKAASVLHMLRHILGDTVFYNTLHNYFNEFAYSNATTNDFRDHVEAASGEDIDWFFDTWLHDWGYPIYSLEYNWVENTGNWDVTVDLEQVQTIGPIFTMPLEFGIYGTSEDTLVVMWNDLQTQSEVFTVSFEPTEVQFDPGHYVLSPHLTGIDDHPQPPPFGTGTLYFTPNPTMSMTVLNWSGMADSELSVTLYDLSGRMLLEWNLNAGDRHMDMSSVPSGLYLVEASGPGNIRQTAKLIIQGRM
ncbi:MAG: T9SS type A sorting domain-containing protein [Candidatus Aegiribacteria sp.]|nr:T9SS type A sorting domain-containing protein [Candidatus Aegiribacteria sp.]